MSESKYKPDDLGRSKVSVNERLGVPVAAVRAIGAEEGDKVRWDKEGNQIVAELIENE